MLQACVNVLLTLLGIDLGKPVHQQDGNDSLVCERDKFRVRPVVIYEVTRTETYLRVAPRVTTSEINSGDGERIYIM